MSTAVIFPGQGSQSVGMGKDLPDGLFNKANEILGYSLSDIMLNGPEADLKLTKNTQPALLTHSTALWLHVSDKIAPAYFAGHSLGEYTALVAAGGITFEDAVKAVHMRGQFMQNSVPVGTGGMLAVIGSQDNIIEAACKEASKEGSIVEPANYNTDGQVVVAGTLDAIERFSSIMKEKGAKRLIPLPVSAPFHCSLMKSAQNDMAEYLKTVNVSELTIPVINNVDAQLETSPEVIKDALIRQMSGAVRWTQSVRKLIDLGVDRFIEVGAGNVLCGLVKKISRDVDCLNISSLEDISKL